MNEPLDDAVMLVEDIGDYEAARISSALTSRGIDSRVIHGQFLAYGVRTKTTLFVRRADLEIAREIIVEMLAESPYPIADTSAIRPRRTLIPLAIFAVFVLAGTWQVGPMPFIASLIGMAVIALAIICRAWLE